MRDRTRRFSVGLGTAGPHHLQLTAVDETTRAWADREGRLMSIVLWKLERELGDATQVARDPAPWQPMPPRGR